MLFLSEDFTICSKHVVANCRSLNDLSKISDLGVGVGVRVGESTLPGRRRKSHRPPPTDPDVNLSAHPARAVQSSVLNTAAPSARTDQVPVSGLLTANPALARGRAGRVERWPGAVHERGTGEARPGCRVPRDGWSAPMGDGLADMSTCPSPVSQRD